MSVLVIERHTALLSKHRPGFMPNKRNQEKREKAATLGTSEEY